MRTDIVFQRDIARDLNAIFQSWIIQYWKIQDWKSLNWKIAHNLIINNLINRNLFFIRVSLFLPKITTNWYFFLGKIWLIIRLIKFRPNTIKAV